jgi:diguanylate cyclase (GGDEF)-like protein
MEQPLRLLIVDDQQPDAELSARQIAAAGYRCLWHRVETETEFRAELKEFAPDLILSDFTLPKYNGLAALALARSEAPATPFIFVSGSIGEERATRALAQGATDYVPKNDRTRLLPAVARALAQTHGRVPVDGSVERIRRLTGALHMLSGMRAAADHIHTHTALLEEACRIVHGSGQYEYSFIALLNAKTHIAHTVAWAGAGADGGTDARFPVATTETSDTSIAGRVLRSGEMVVCLDIDQYPGAVSSYERSATSPGGAFVSLPLPASGRTVGALSVGVPKHAHISEQELLLLEEFARQISFALQRLPDEHTSQQLSLLDPLTGLSRRELFCEHLTQLLRQQRKASAPTTVIVFDIERLRDINDAHGRHVGDRLLQSVAERLKRRFGDGAGLAHFGGGTFAAAFAECRAPRDPSESATAAFGQPFAIGAHPVPVTVKCGMATFPGDGRDAETLVQRAEVTLEKMRLRSSTAGHSQSANGLGGRDPKLQERLRLALKKQQFLLQYQPIIDRGSGEVTAAEAFLRWRDPEQGLIPPGVFMPTLETSGLIVPVGEWVLAQATRDCARWHSLGLPRFRVAVNVSSAELGRMDFAPYFLEASRHARAACGIDVEISESALAGDPEVLRQTLKALRAEGVRVAIDDFGMGYSSLNGLAGLPLDTLKIDRSFVDHLTEEPQSQAVVSTILALARACNLCTVAKGVETAAQLEILDSLGCDESQGYFHCPPVSAEELELFVGSTVRARDSE